jgi:hypothetical protein
MFYIIPALSSRREIRLTSQHVITKCNTVANFSEFILNKLILHLFILQLAYRNFWLPLVSYAMSTGIKATEAWNCAFCYGWDYECMEIYLHAVYVSSQYGAKVPCRCRATSVKVPCANSWSNAILRNIVLEVTAVVTCPCTSLTRLLRALCIPGASRDCSPSHFDMSPQLHSHLYLSDRLPPVSNSDADEVFRVCPSEKWQHVDL